MTASLTLWVWADWASFSLFELPWVLSLYLRGSLSSKWFWGPKMDKPCSIRRVTANSISGSFLWSYCRRLASASILPSLVSLSLARREHMPLPNQDLSRKDYHRIHALILIGHPRLSVKALYPVCFQVFVLAEPRYLLWASSLSLGAAYLLGWPLSLLPLDSPSTASSLEFMN